LRTGMTIVDLCVHRTVEYIADLDSVAYFH